MKRILRLAILSVVVAALTQTGTAFAQDKTSAPLLCVPIEVMQCDAGGQCLQGTAEDVNLPYFIKIDLGSKRLSGVGSDAGRTTAIDFMQRENGRIVLHGRGQNGRSWTATITEATGKLSAAVAEEGSAFLIFGACTSL